MQKYSPFLTFLTILLLQGLCHDNILAQSRSFAGLPIMSPSKDSANVDFKYSDDLNHLPEYNRINNIYEKLVAAKGDSRMRKPELNLRDEVRYAASMDYKLIEISLEKKAYDVAVNYGDAAIAFLLAHELIHYYEKHGWRTQYTIANSDLETGKILGSINDKIINEVQADVLGGFLAYSAGFGNFENGGKLINDLYKEYKMKEEIENYPSKNERIKLAERNKEKMTKLSSLYEMAGLLSVIGKYKEAYFYYEHLLNIYQSRELYNNAGLTCMILANSLMNQDSIKFELPGVMDLEFSGDSRSASKYDEINKHINEALNHFETCIIMDKTYLPAYINKSSALIIKAINCEPKIRNITFKTVNHILDGQWEELKIVHPQLDFDKYQDEILVLRSILAYFQNDKTTSINLMTKAADNGSENAKKNLAIINEIPLSNTISDKGITINFDSVTVEKLLLSEKFGPNKTEMDPSKSNIFRVLDKSKENFKFYLHEYKGTQEEFGYDLGFIVSKKSFTNAFLGDLKLGSDKKDVIATLGQPKRALSHINGEILNFNDRIIIITNQEGKVEKLIDFKKIDKP